MKTAISDQHSAISEEPKKESVIPACPGSFRQKDSRQAGMTSLRIILSLLMIMLSVHAASAELTAKANHDHIKIDFFYHGSTVSVSGISDPNTDIIIKLSSPDGHETLKQKGKVGGLLWMNTGTLKLENVPNLYSVHSTRKIEDLLSQDELDRQVIGFPALGRHMEITPSADNEDRSKWLGEFLKYKRSSNLYSESTGKIELKDENGMQKYYINTEWPYQAPPGDYTATVYAVKNGRIADTAIANVLVEQVGMVKSLAGMAKNNAILYGLISIVSALGAGFGVGLVFRKGGGAH